MSPDDRIPFSDWLLAGVLATGLHAILLLALGASDLSRLGEPQGESHAAARLRVALGSGGPAAAPAQPVAPSVPKRAPRRPPAAPKPAPGTSADAPAPPRAEAAEPPAPLGAETAALAGGDVAAAPAVSASGAPDAEARRASAEARARGEARSDYFGALHARVRDALAYPRRARQDGVEGTVVLRIRIDREGGIEGSEVAESSGFRVLDRQAQRIARRAAPFGPVPAHFREEDLHFELPVEFSLTD